MKLRKENNVSRSEYTQVRDQLQELRARARGDSRGAAATDSRSVDQEQHRVERHLPALQPAPIYDDRPRGSTTARRGIPAGQEIDVRIQTRADV